MKSVSVIAMPLDRARAILQEAGIPVVAVESTAPPAGRGPRPGAELRVVRERYTSAGATLTVAEAIAGPERRTSDH